MKQTILRELGDGLVLRRATAADADALCAFNAKIHGTDSYDARAVAAWTRDLLLKPHPTFQPEDFLIVEKSGTGEIVSSLSLISQTWAYEGIPFGVGRPELVGTLPEYRGKGLVRVQFDVIHEWSRERGELVQIITGIPFFYRQFGYEMGLEMGGSRRGSEGQVPQLKENEEDPYHVRPAREADIPFLMRMKERADRYSMITSVRDEAIWRYEILGKSQENVNRLEFCVIEAQDGTLVGYLAYPWFAWGTTQVVTEYQLAEDVSYLSVTPSVLRYLRTLGQRNAQARGQTLQTVGLELGTTNLAYHAAEGMLPVENRPYAFYVRVPNLPAFLQHIAPILERRLRDSAVAGHSGELKISFYREGLRMVLEKGKLACVEPWKPKINEDEGAAAFPNLTFLQLVFGYRSLSTLRAAYADVGARPDAKILLETMFPAKPSYIWSLS